MSRRSHEADDCSTVDPFGRLDLKVIDVRTVSAIRSKLIVRK